MFDRDWDEIDEEAAREGSAIRRRLNVRRSRKPHGASRDDIKKDTKEDLLKKLNIIAGEPCP